MKIQMQKPLFAWDCLEDHPVLATIKQLLEAIPDGKLAAGLEAARGKGRNDYPVRALWGVVLLTIALHCKRAGSLHAAQVFRRLAGFVCAAQVVRRQVSGVFRYWHCGRRRRREGRDVPPR